PLQSQPFIRRSAFANIPSTGLTWWETPQTFIPGDAAMESIVGKIAPLATIRQNYFTIIMVAQVIQDVGAIPNSGDVLEINGISAELKRFDPGADKVLAQQKVMAV